MATLKHKKTLPMSPLRYPGAKRWLASYVGMTLQSNSSKPKLFVEPFAGGASVSLAMLELDIVEKIGLMDKDPMVAAFWKTLFFDTDWLIDSIESCEISLEEWNRLKSLKTTDRRTLAYQCLFLNRTSFSGILHPNAGPIGGQLQESSYSIDCRFNKATVIKRILKAASWKDRVEFVWNWSWRKGLQSITKHSKEDIFVYLDPPFYKKADKLYTHCFNSAEHIKLRDYLSTLQSPWLLSYDGHPDIEKLYADFNKSRVDIAYSTSDKGRRDVGKEIIVSSLPTLVSALKIRSSKANHIKPSPLKNQAIPKDVITEDPAALVRPKRKAQS